MQLHTVYGCSLTRFGTCRYVTTIIIEVVYGHRITTDDDPYLKLANDALHHAIPSGSIRGGCAVDFFPICTLPLDFAAVVELELTVCPVVRHFPSWFPGAYYVGRAREVRPMIDRLYEYPLADVRQKMVRGCVMTDRDPRMTRTCVCRKRGL
jgi:hypothetical protein